MELGNDVWYQIMYQADYESIKLLSQTNKYTEKLYNDNNFWKEKIVKDYPFAIDYSNQYYTLYTKLNDFFNKYTLLLTDTNVIEIKNILINHISELLSIINKPLNERKILKSKIVTKTINNLLHYIDLNGINKIIIGTLFIEYKQEFNLKIKMF